MAGSSSTPFSRLGPTQLQQAVASYSENSIFQLSRLLSGHHGQKKAATGAFKRKVGLALAPFRCCFQPVAVEGLRPGTQEIFYMADMKQVLRQMAQQCASLHDLLLANTGRELRVTLAHDECTAGNVLNPQLRQKTLLFYCTLNIFQPIRDSGRAWIPVGALSHDQVKRCRGGIASATRAFLRRWFTDDLQTPFAVGDNCHVSLRLIAFISDLDSQRAAFAAKGSAALKPCMFCSNCVARGAAAATNDPEHFFTILEDNFDRFVKNDVADLKRCIARWLVNVDTMAKADKEMREKCIGFVLEKQSLWGCPVVSAKFDLSMAMNDSMHCYFSNGIANSEIILLVTAAKEHLGVSLDALKAAMETAEWRRHAPTETRYWSKRLWTPALFGQEVYKGSADQTKALLPLLRWICASVWLPVPAMRPHCECFLQLCRCVDYLRSATEPTTWRQLDREQRKHQRMFAALYPDSVRPKHHHRLHLPEHYAKVGVAISCLGVEASHQDFKKLYAEILQQFLRAEDSTGEYSKQLLPRMLLRSLEAFNSSPFLIHGFELLNPFSATEVAAATRIENATLSASCRLHQRTLRENDVLLWGNDLTSGGLFQFCLAKENQLYLYISVLDLAENQKSHKSFRVSNTKAFVHYESLPGGLHVPSWWAAKDAVITCLP